jgi:hypothetical protein
MECRLFGSPAINGLQLTTDLIESQKRVKSVATFQQKIFLPQGEIYKVNFFPPKFLIPKYKRKIWREKN